MFSFFKKKRNQSVPEWASFFTYEEYNRFIQVVEAYFKSIDVKATIQDGVVTAPKEALGLGQLGLSNLAQICRGQEPGIWKEIVADHFATLKRSSQFGQEFEKRIGDFDYVKEYIATRLFNTEVLRGDSLNIFVRKDIVPDVFSMLCFDFPDSLVNVKPDQAALWQGRTHDELLSLGKENVRKKYAFEMSLEKLGDSQVWVVAGHHFFIPNIIFDLDRYPQFNSSHGMLVGIPNRHTALIYPIHDLHVVVTITTLTQVIAGAYREGPGSLSPRMYWYKDGHFEDLPFDLTGGEVKFRPTENFLDLLNKLESPLDGKANE
jgi:hypothetical protein